MTEPFGGKTSDCVRGKCRVRTTLEPHPNLLEDVDRLTAEKARWVDILRMLDSKVPGHGLSIMALARHKRHSLLVQQPKGLRDIADLVKPLKSIKAPEEVATNIQILHSERDFLVSIPPEDRTPTQNAYLLKIIDEIRLWTLLSQQVGELEMRQPIDDQIQNTLIALRNQQRDLE